MPTYAENAHRRTIAARRLAQDRRDAALHRQFDLSSQDTHVKSERLTFAVVGEGTRTAIDNYRAGWDRIFRGRT